MSRHICKALLHAAVVAAAVAAASGTRAQPVDPRSTVIGKSYTIAFCRGPSPAETRYWLGQPSAGDLNALIASHREYLKSNDKERADTIGRSYVSYSAFRRSPTAGERAHWDPIMRTTGYTCEELVNFHRNYIAANPGALPAPKPIVPNIKVEPEPRPVKKPWWQFW